MTRFNGGKLREAREARNITGTSLAELVGISASSISQFEHGTKQPHSETLEKIASRLNLPVFFFMEEGDDEGDLGLFFRSLSAATKAARTKERRRFRWHVRVTDFVHEFAMLPPINLPSLRMPQNPGHIENSDIEQIAEGLRAFWNLDRGPLANVIETLEANGVIVARFKFEADSLDAYSGLGTSNPHIILGDDKGVAVRSRFDAAHELGHIVLHRNIPLKGRQAPEVHKELERQAHYFAGAFLLPGRAFSEEFVIPTLDSLVMIKPKWKTSVAAMIMRATSLDLISDDEYERLLVARARRGWTKREPYDDVLPVEQPTVLRAAFELGFSSGRISAAQVRLRIALFDSDIEQLANLPPGFLSHTSSNVVQLKDERQNYPDGEAKVIAFPFQG